jgi:hypothetical protein
MLAGKPWCAVCNKFVDKLTRHELSQTCETILIAHCHGQTERMIVSEELMRVGYIKAYGECFAAKQLPVANKLLSDS